MGCELDVQQDQAGAVTVYGDCCKLGRQYAHDEITDPRRIVTSTVKVRQGTRPLVPVWTPEPISKDKVLQLMRQLRRVELQAPVHAGQVVLPNAADTGVDVKTSAAVPRARPPT